MEPVRQYCANVQNRPDIAAEAAGLAQRDRRMHLRAYNYWASMLGRRRFPTVADLSNGTLADIAPHSVLLDFSAEVNGPTIAYLGERLESECAVSRGMLRRLEDAPANSLLARLAGHYNAVLVNRAPTGFEAEFVGLRGLPLVYRGILLPFSSDDVMIDFVLAVINWKELLADEAPARSGDSVNASTGRRSALLTDWADGPASEISPAPGPISRAAAFTLPEDEMPSWGPEAASIPAALAEELRKLPFRACEDLSPAGPEFALAMIRRSADGPVALLGEVPHDPSLLEQAARRLVC